MRPDILEGETPRFQTPCGFIYITLNYLDGEVKECFSHLGKSGSCSRAMLEALGRVISLAIRQGVSQKDISRTLQGIMCGNCDNREYLSCPHALGIALEVKEKA